MQPKIVEINRMKRALEDQYVVKAVPGGTLSLLKSFTEATKLNKIYSNLRSLVLKFWEFVFLAFLTCLVVRDEFSRGLHFRPGEVLEATSIRFFLPFFFFFFLFFFLLGKRARSRDGRS